MFTSRLLDNKDSPQPAGGDKHSQRSGSAKVQSLQKQLLDSGVEKDPHLSNIRDKLNASGIRSGRQKLSSNVTARTPSGTSMVLNSTLPSPASRTRSHDASSLLPSEDRKPTGPPSGARPVEMVQLPAPRLIQGPYGMPLIQTEVPASEANEFPPKHMANPFRNSTSLRDLYPPIAPRRDPPPVRSKLADAEVLPTVGANYELGALAHEPSKFFLDDSPRAAKPVGNPRFFPVDKLARSIPRQQQLLFDVAKRTPLFPMGPKQPLFVMNLSVDSAAPKKLYVFADTDPWQKAYQFVETHNLEDEMVPLLADLIEADQRKYLGEIQSTPARQQTPLKVVDTPSTAQTEVVGRGARQTAFDRLVLERPPLSPVGAGSAFDGGFHMGQRADVLDSMVDSRTDWVGPPPPVSASVQQQYQSPVQQYQTPVQQNMQYQSPQNTQYQPPVQQHQRPPTPQKIGRPAPVQTQTAAPQLPLHSSTSSDAFYLKESGPVSTVAPHILHFVQKMQTQPPPRLSADDESLCRRLFDAIDAERRGTIKSFEVSLSPLPREVRSVVGPVLRTLDEQNADGAHSAGFESITYDLFVRTLVDSGKLPQIKQIYART